MSDSRDEEAEQRMDALLLRLLKTPPQSRAELAEQVRRAKKKKPGRKRSTPAGGKAKRGATI